MGSSTSKPADGTPTQAWKGYVHLPAHSPIAGLQNLSLTSVSPSTGPVLVAYRTTWSTPSRRTTRYAFNPPISTRLTLLRHSPSNRSTASPPISTPAQANSPQSNTTRSQLLELQVQARVAEELKKLQAKEAAALSELHDKLAAVKPGNDAAADPSSAGSRQQVAKEVEALRAKLEGRKKLQGWPAEVERARGEVVRCLRENDRRPLDCWREVEAFKEEVKRLEKGWVDKVVS